MPKIEQGSNGVTVTWQGRSLSLIDASPELMLVMRDPEVSRILRGLVADMGETDPAPRIPAGFLQQLLHSAGLLKSPNL